MSRAIGPALIVLGVLHFVGCGGDDTVNPSNPDAGATAAKDATTGDAKPSDAGGGDAKTASADGSSDSGGSKEASSEASTSGLEAATDAPVGDGS
jgi:hypothetical protein